MSSTYRLLCLNHDPALVISGGEWSTADPAINAALEPATHDWLVEDHGKCDLLVGRYSAALVEVCCPGSPVVTGHKTHSEPVWIDKDWLVLLHAASAAPHDPAIAAAIGSLVWSQSCWTWQRVSRLASELGIETPADALLPPQRSTRLRCQLLPSEGSLAGPTIVPGLFRCGHPGCLGRHSTPYEACC